MRVWFFILILLLLIPYPVSALDDVSIYRETTEVSSLFLRGHKAYDYPSRIEEAPWCETAEFRKGEIEYNGLTFVEVKMNIDTIRQDLATRDIFYGMDKVVLRDGVSRFRLGGKTFFNPPVLYGKIGLGGFWDVLYDGHAEVLKQVSKRLTKEESGLTVIRSEVLYGLSPLTGLGYRFRRRHLSVVSG